MKWSLQSFAHAITAVQNLVAISGPAIQLLQNFHQIWIAGSNSALKWLSSISICNFIQIYNSTSHWWSVNISSSSTQRAVSILRCRLTNIGIPMLKIRRSCDRLIFNMGIPIPGKDSLYIETGPWCWMGNSQQLNQWWPSPRIIFNSMAPGRCGTNFKSVIYKHMLWIKFISTSGIVK